MPPASLVGYILAQVAGAIAAAAVLYVIASGKADFQLGGFAANGYGEHSPGGYSLTAALVTEVVMTAFFLSSFLARRIAVCPWASRPSPSAWG